MTAGQITYYVVVVAFLALGIGLLAKSKGYPATSWVFLALIFWPVAFIILLTTSDNTEKPTPSNRGWLITGGVLSTIFGLAVTGIVVAAGLAAVGGLPQCQSADAITMVKSALADAPFGKVHGLALISAKDFRQVDRSETEVKCFAQARLNDASEHPMNYRFYIEDGQLFVEASFPPA